MENKELVLSDLPNDCLVRHNSRRTDLPCRNTVLKEQSAQAILGRITEQIVRVLAQMQNAELDTISEVDFVEKKKTLLVGANCNQLLSGL
jgi:hypothetical protein